MNLLLAALLVFLLNLPFGFWRANLRKLSFWWFASIHIPIPFVVWVRYAFGIGFALYSYPIFIFAFFSGQFLGGYIKRNYFTNYKIEPEIKISPQRKLVGQKEEMSLTKNKTRQLWKTFMPLRHKIRNQKNTDLISMQMYSEPSKITDKKAFFTKWACVEVEDFDNIPKKMNSIILEEGLYAVFHYRGLSTNNNIFKYIFGEWLANSKYELDNRPHFEILGEKYKNNDPKSEEDIWIPIKTKS